MLIKVNDNATYHLIELDGTRLALPLDLKRIKTFNKRQDKQPYIEGLKNVDNDEELDVVTSRQQLQLYMSCIH